jgi:stearoyl-CoA desaturase (Delta-9 desaturase)
VATIDIGSSEVEEFEVVLSEKTPKNGVPFALVHLGALAVFLVGWSWAAIICAAVTYIARALGITVFYHRGFAHRAFTMRRWVQFSGAWVGASAAQRGPLWWVGTHRIHHRYTDRPGDPHSPVVDGFFYSHVGWLFRKPVLAPARVDDLAQFSELRFVDRFHYLAAISVMVSTFVAGVVLNAIDPALHTSGWQMLVWGFFVSTTLLYHATFAVNSLAHQFGKRRFDTKDDSRNNAIVSLLTMGEGWHNNHHRYPVSARQGLTLFEFDPSWWTIRAMASLGWVRNLRAVPAAVWKEAGLKPRVSRIETVPSAKSSSDDTSL